MELRSRGFSHYTTYELEGANARITGHYAREQTQAGLAPRAAFTLPFYGSGGGLTVGVRAVSINPGHVVARAVPATTPAAVRPRAVSLIDALVPTIEEAPAGDEPHPYRRRVMTSPRPRTGADGMTEDGVFDPWGDMGQPPTFPIDPPLPPGGGGGGFLHAAVRVELYAPGIDDQPVQTWDLPEAVAGNMRTLTYAPQGRPAPDAPVNRTGWWRVVVTPEGPYPVMIRVEATAIMGRRPLRTFTMSERLFNHVFRVVLEALVPRAVVDGSRLTVSMGPDLARELGISPVLYTKNISPIVTHAKLASLNITAVSGRKFKEIAAKHHRNPLGLNHVADDHIAIRVQAAFQNASASAYGFDVARLDGEFGELVFSFNYSLTEMWPGSFIDVDFSTLADWVISIASLFSEVDHDIINTSIESPLRDPDTNRAMRTYVREVLSRALGQHAVLHDVRYANGGWVMRYFDDFLIPAYRPGWRPPVTPGTGGPLGGGRGPVVIGGRGDGTTGAGAGAGSGGSGGSSAPSDPPGVMPAEFEVVGGDALTRLDAHQSLVVIMMENRSYDHLLGGLAAARPRPGNPYDGPPSSAANAATGGFFDTVPLVEARSIGMGTAIPVSPNHHHHPVLFQMGDGTEENSGSGAMQGFARDLHKRTDSPQLAMTMYGERDLPVYYQLADQFCVCDRWFCAHPGPTWPNRFATVTGAIPDLENFEVDDPRIGFLDLPNIFDTLNRHNIDWRVFESDLSLVRMFDHYRLDDRNVLPIDDPLVGLDATLRAPGPLPRVMFVEPNFADIPPLATANDDHPPADLAAGQAFIARVCDAIWSANRFRDCLVVITYDEHGGFYDHVAPPGTAVAEAASPSPVGPRSKLHPDGPEFLGPRVPAFILSPYISAGRAEKTVFDHTSILKTILVHNRSKLPGSVFTSFGARVNAAAHLGQALDLASPRATPRTFDPKRRPPTRGGGGRGRRGEAPRPPIVVSGGTSSSPGGAPRTIPPRTVTVVPRAGAPGEDVGEPEGAYDYHAALKRVFRPRQ
jgi:phospholipase C